MHFLILVGGQVHDKAMFSRLCDNFVGTHPTCLHFWPGKRRWSLHEYPIPQANGRAEVAGRTVINTLRKLHTDNEINWVESLPRVLRLKHDLPDPETDLSPYHLLFGRERPLVGLPFSLPRAHPDAEEFFDGIQKVDEFARQALLASLKAQEMVVNRKRPSWSDIKEGDWVFMQRPTAFAGPKMQTSWMGPYKVATQTGLN